MIFSIKNEISNADAAFKNILSRDNSTAAYIECRRILIKNWITKNVMKKVKLIIVYPDGSFKQEEATLGSVLRLLTNGFFLGKKIDCIIIDPVNENNPEFEVPNKKAT